ncbi:MAG: cobalamin-binding protein [Deltaproteobacteria bacterium]|nr:cobalamin-binding protein [Deltaproteobacteria bacterium]
MKFFILIFSLLPFPALCLAAWFTDEAGRTVELKGPPGRIVSLAPSVTEILFALGLEDRVIGVTTYCNFPPEALAKEKVGGYLNPSLERVASLRPDLVFGTADGASPEFVRKLKELGTPFYLTNPAGVAGVLRTIRHIGEVTDTLSAATGVEDSIRKGIQNVMGKVEGKRRPRVLHVLAHDPLITSGRGTLVDDLIRLAGGLNVAGNSAAKYPRYGLEEVVLRDPEVLILSPMGPNESHGAQKAWWVERMEISATRHSRIFFVDGDLILRPSPRIALGLTALARALHPEASSGVSPKRRKR